MGVHIVRGDTVFQPRRRRQRYFADRRAYCVLNSSGALPVYAHSPALARTLSLAPLAHYLQRDFSPALIADILIEDVLAYPVSARDGEGDTYQERALPFFSPPGPC